VIPSDPYDAKGLLISAIRGDDPVIFMEPKRIYRSIKTEVPEGEYTVPIGEAKVAREGKDMTVVAWGAMLHVALEAAKRAADDDIQCEVIDVRSIVPLDEQKILDSVRKTGRLVIVHEAQRTAGFGAEIAALVAEKAIDSIEAPIARVTGFDTPFPYTLEDVYMPDVDRVLRSVLATARYE
jgi:2-oxoisovalerate dehydrogenase E1 component beta subunit